MFPMIMSSLFLLCALVSAHLVSQFDSEPFIFHLSPSASPFTTVRLEFCLGFFSLFPPFKVPSFVVV